MGNFMKKYRVRSVVKRHSVKNIMKKYLELNKSLNTEMSVEYWENEESSFAAELLSGFSTEDWHTLEETWPKKSAIWQERCAKILASTPSPISFRILAHMSMSRRMGVVGQALQSIAKLSPDFRTELETLDLIEKNVQDANISDRFRKNILATIERIKAEML